MISEHIHDLEKRFSEIETENPREAAEVAFAIAVYYRTKDAGKANRFAEKSIELFEQCGTDTMEKCSAMNVSIGGIAIPDLIHDDVVRAHFPEFFPVPA